MSLAYRTYAPDLDAYTVGYGERGFLQLFAGDSRLGADNRTAPLAVRRVIGCATDDESARLLAALDEATVRRLYSEWRAEWARHNAHSLSGAESQFVWRPFPEWPVTP